MSLAVRRWRSEGQWVVYIVYIRRSCLLFEFKWVPRVFMTKVQHFWLRITKILFGFNHYNTLRQLKDSQQLWYVHHYISIYSKCWVLLDLFFQPNKILNFKIRTKYFKWKPVGIFESFHWDLIYSPFVLLLLFFSPKLNEHLTFPGIPHWRISVTGNFFPVASLSVVGGVWAGSWWKNRDTSVHIRFPSRSLDNTWRFILERHEPCCYSRCLFEQHPSYSLSVCTPSIITLQRGEHTA